MAQVIGGLLSGNPSLLSDALHNFSDVISFIFSYIATVLSRRKASTNKTFVYKRVEIITAFVNTSSLIVVALILIKKVVVRFINPQEIESNLVIWLSLVVIVGNGFRVLLLKKDANSNMKSVYLHLLSDIMASVAVLIVGLLMMFFKWYRLF